MKKSLILALVAVFATCVARAGEVTPEMAKQAASAWAARNPKFGAGGSAQSVRTVCDTNAAHQVLWHQVTMSGGGCLIVAPNTEIEPVLAALEEDLERLGQKRRVWAAHEHLICHAYTSIVPYAATASSTLIRPLPTSQARARTCAIAPSTSPTRTDEITFA